MATGRGQIREIDSEILPTPGAMMAAIGYQEINRTTGG
jgi:hypothetical protein